MSFVLSKIFWIIAQPLNAIIILMMLGFALSALGRAHLGSLALKVSLIALVTACVLPVGQILLLPLENRFPQPELPEHVDGIVALGGGVMTDISKARGEIAFSDTAERFTTLVALARRYPDARVVFTGGNGNLWGDPNTSEADIMRRFLKNEGIDPARVILEDRSRNTWENVVLCQPLVAPKRGETWLLITSAVHMPRAMGIFRKRMWAVTPYPVDYKTTGGISVADIDFLERMSELDAALKEWIGLVAYYAMDRTSSLFPGP